MGKLGLFALLCSIAVAASGQEVTPINDDVEDYRNQVEELNQRYVDFFSRDQENQRYYRSLSSGIPDLKAERQKGRDEERKAMLEYRSERRPKPDTAALEAEHDAEVRAQAREHDRYRKDFVQQRAQLKRISESARKIPENRDAGLE